MIARKPPAERGYALLAAVAALVVFAALALMLASATRISVASADGELSHARAEQAAEAGIAIATHGLIAGSEDYVDLLRARRRTLEFDGSTITVRISDERGKVPLAHIEGETVTRLLANTGLADENLAIAADSLADWIDDDDQPRAHGAEAFWYAPLGIAPRNGPLQSIGELARVRGIGPRLAQAMAPYVTVDPDVKTIDPTFATPQAIALTSEAGDLAPGTLARAREAEGEQTALGTTKAADLVGRPLTVSVDVQTADGARAHREVVLVLTGNADQPVAIHAVR